MTSITQETSVVFNKLVLFLMLLFLIFHLSFVSFCVTKLCKFVFLHLFMLKNSLSKVFFVDLIFSTKTKKKDDLIKNINNRLSQSRLKFKSFFLQVVKKMWQPKFQKPRNQARCNALSASPGTETVPSYGRSAPISPDR